MASVRPVGSTPVSELVPASPCRDHSWQAMASFGRRMSWCGHGQLLSTDGLPWPWPAESCCGHHHALLCHRITTLAMARESIFCARWTSTSMQTTHPPTLSLPHALAHSLTHSLTHSPTVTIPTRTTLSTLHWPSQHNRHTDERQGDTCREAGQGVVCE
jgi:hypothetical protein